MYVGQITLPVDGYIMRLGFELVVKKVRQEGDARASESEPLLITRVNRLSPFSLPLSK